MRRLGIALLALGFLLTGCSSSWEGEVRFKVTEVLPERENKSGQLLKPHVLITLDQEMSKDEPALAKEGADLDQFPADVKAGDAVLCQVRSHDDNAFDDVGPKVTISSCRKA
ncbi:hypothetical protein [Actinosynnema sp.]|uniref:hypothetical protein n=1 Tax=Actinosynnema sp. TaxID=1872144 RepID=UPI003F8690AE